MSPGQRLRRRIRETTDLLVYVDLLEPADGFAEGAVHVAHLSWTPVAHPNDVVAVGDELELVVVRVADFLSLGLKQLVDDPYPRANVWFPVGSTTSGRIVRFHGGGADVEIAPGVIGTLHVRYVKSTMRVGFRAFTDSADVAAFRSPYVPLGRGTRPLDAASERIVGLLGASERTKIRWLFDCIEHAAGLLEDTDGVMLDKTGDLGVVRAYVELGRA